MERSEAIADFLIDLWREASRQVDLGTSIGNLLAIFRRRMDVGGLVIYGIEAGPSVHRLAAAPAGCLRTVRGTAVGGQEARAIVDWCRQGELGRLNPRRPGRSALAPLCGELEGEECIAGALMASGEPAGVLIVLPRHAGALGKPERRAIAAALEPFAAAVEKSSRMHALDTLRAAAEADRIAALARLGRESLSNDVIGNSGGLRPVMERVGLVGASDVPVLIFGETGSGKEVIARAIHVGSKRRSGPFVRVNCGAIPPELVDSQLFGHERGAFTGATERRQGWFERADGGTLLLDEIGELPLAAQVRLLRVLQDGALERVGGQETLHVDCRVIAATHRDLPAMVQTGRFREDLWYRLSVFPIVLPPLRERLEDLPELVRHFVHRAAVRYVLPEVPVSEADLRLLRSYAWPGNIRELAAVVDRAAILGNGKRLDFEAALGPQGYAPAGPSRVHPRSPGEPEAPNLPTLGEAMRRHIERALEAAGGRIEGGRGAAALLGINPHTLRSRMRKLGLDWARFRA
jgi:transcriptional regulator with GAF, ATPase, and Fis domain